jgi:hypothetical protein
MCQFGIQNDPLAANGPDELFDGMIKNYGGSGFHEVVSRL